MKLFLPFRVFQKLYISFIAFGIVILSSTFGYMAIEHFTFVEALYMTIITISTVGFAEVRPLNDDGRIFTIVIILANLTTFTYFLTQLSNYFLDGEFVKQYKIYKMKEEISQLKGHVIICGFGRNGHEAAQLFTEHRKEFVVIEKSGGDNKPLDVKFYFHADATRDEVLLEAGIKNASALIASLPDDADNLFVVLTARDLNPELKIISRASRDSSVKKLKSAGANNVIMPDKIGGAHMASLVLNPDVKEFLDLLSVQGSTDCMIDEVPVQKHLLIKELDAWNKTGATVLGVKNPKKEFIINPPKDFLLKPDMQLVAMGTKAQIALLAEEVG